LLGFYKDSKRFFLKKEELELYCAIGSLQAFGRFTFIEIRETLNLHLA